jgi:hypothetical protein
MLLSIGAVNYVRGLNQGGYVHNFVTCFSNMLVDCICYLDVWCSVRMLQTYNLQMALLVLLLANLNLRNQHGVHIYC